MAILKTEKEIEIMREGGKGLAGIIKELEALIKPGVSAKFLDDKARELILKQGGKPSFFDYQGFPGALCVSINEEIVHIIPKEETEIKEGDIVSLDLGMLYKGFHTDMARTFPVGSASKEAKDLIEVTKEALLRGIEKAKTGNILQDISEAIDSFVESKGYVVIRELCGHGIGKEVHEEPQILNYVSKDQPEIEIKQGMVLCIEPMVTKGDWRIKKAKDGYGFATKGGTLSAHFEDTVAITKEGNLVLTRI